MIMHTNIHEIYFIKAFIISHLHTIPTNLVKKELKVKYTQPYNQTNDSYPCFCFSKCNLNRITMAKESVLILRKRIDLPELLSQLNAALSEEWLAFYQYWIGSLVVEGAMRSDVQREFEAHAMEEFKHARELADRIVQLEGVPVLDPQQWSILARCKYSVPLEADVLNLLKQNIAAERCAIVRYEEIASFCNNVDYTTCDIAKRIMADEEEHEQDLQDLLRDVEWIVRAVEAKC